MKIKLLLKLLFLSFLLTLQSYSQWSVLTSSGDRTLNSVSLYSPFYGFAVGDTGTIRKTANGGQVWTLSNAGTNLNLNKVLLTGATTAFICGNQGSIFRTTNSGTNWVLLTATTSYNYYDMDFRNANTGVVVGDSRYFAITGNGGTNWIMGQINVSGPQGLDLTAVDMIDSLVSYIGSSDTLVSGQYTSYIYKSTNSGVSYSAVWSVQNAQHCGIADIQFINPNTGFALTQNSTLLRTISAGNSWSPITFGGGIKSIWFVNALTGYACGINSDLRKTTNGGLNWLSQNSPTGIHMYDNVFYDTIKGFAVGSSGVIIGTFNGGTYVGINQTGSEIPGEFSLRQNYPNPFNPSTKISFDIPVQTFSKLVIYDILGNEVAVLLNGMIDAGKYEADFDASKLPSGTYFYRLEAGDFVQTKKMILIK